MNPGLLQVVQDFSALGPQNVLASGGSVVTDGSLLLAIPVAAAAGLVSFLSPCVLPLVPGYLSYMTGLSGAELDLSTTTGPNRHAALAYAGGSPNTAGQNTSGDLPHAADEHGERRPRLTATAQTRTRVLTGTLLFVLGFTSVFVSYGVAFGGLGSVLLEYQRALSVIFGSIVVVLGLGFLGVVPTFNRDARIHRRPRRGLWGAPLLGIMFGLGWTPCIGPTLAAVQTLAFTEGSAARGALLSAAYCLGLGLPFIAMGLAYRRALGALPALRRNSRTITIIGGVLLILIGIALITGLWNDLNRHLAGLVGSWETVL